MSLNEKQIELLENLYNDASLGLTTGKKLYDHLKLINEPGYPLPKIDNW